MILNMLNFNESEPIILASKDLQPYKAIDFNMNSLWSFFSTLSLKDIFDILQSLVIDFQVFSLLSMIKKHTKNINYLLVIIEQKHILNNRKNAFK